MTDHTHLAPAYGDPNDMSTYQAEGSPIARLMATYPHLFQNGGPHWSDLPDGWYSIATEFMDLVDRHLGPGLAPYFRIDQCKEKLAALRVYWSLHGRPGRHGHHGNRPGVSGTTEMPGISPNDPRDDPEDEIELDADGEEIRQLPPGLAQALERAQAAIRAEQQSILDRSLLTCQECAAPGRLRRFAWMLTLCDGCTTTLVQTRGEREITMAERHLGIHPGGRVDGQDSW